MKSVKLFLFSLCVIFNVHNAAAQKYGVRGGANFASLSGGDIQNSGNISSFYVGAFKEMTLVPKLLFIQPEIQFSKQGFSTASADVNLNYINVPVMAKVYFLKFLSLETGPQFGFKVGGDTSGYDVNTVDKAWVGGLGFNFPLGLFIDARYIGGFNEVVKGYNSKSQVVQVGLGFKF